MSEKQKYNEITQFIQGFLNENERVIWHGKPRILPYYMNYYRLKYVVWAYLLAVVGLLASNLLQGNAIEVLIIALVVPAFVAIPIALILLRGHFKENFTDEVVSILSALYCVTNQRVLIFAYDHNELIHEYSDNLESIEVYFHKADWGDIVFETRRVVQPSFPYNHENPYTVTIGFKSITNLTHVSSMVSDSLNAKIVYKGNKRKSKQTATG